MHYLCFFPQKHITFDWTHEVMSRGQVARYHVSFRGGPLPRSRGKVNSLRTADVMSRTFITDEAGIDRSSVGLAECSAQVCVDPVTSGTFQGNRKWKLTSASQSLTHVLLGPLSACGLEGYHWYQDVIRSWRVIQIHQKPQRNTEQSSSNKQLPSGYLLKTTKS